MDFDDNNGLILHSRSGAYEVLDNIGRGSFGIVLKAKKIEVNFSVYYVVSNCQQ